MGLSLNNLFQRPYINQDNQSGVKKRGNDEKTSQTQGEQQSNQNAKSKGLAYVDKQKTTYTPVYEQKFTIPAQNAYSNVNINYTRQNRSITQQTTTNTTTTEESTPNNNLGVANNQINIAQILKDFENTAIAIGTPDDLKEIVDGYLGVVSKQVKTGSVDTKLVKSTLNNAASVLDNYISETLNKDSKVVENWVDALFLQNIDFNYNEEEINERFLVKFPDGSTSQTKKVQQAPEEFNENETQQITTQAEEQRNVTSTKIPQDTELKTLFIQAKKYALAQDPENAIRSFEQALNRAQDINDDETSGKIYYEVGKIYDDYDYVTQALQSYNKSLRLTTDENVKTQAHYSMAKIYDENNIIDTAVDHYFSTVSHAGEADNITAQSTSLTKIGNIYADMYEKDAFNYYDLANDMAEETDNNNLKGFIASNTGNAYTKFEEPEKALKAYSSAVKNYSQTESPVRTAQNYMAAADIMVEFNSLNKAQNLLNKAQNYAQKTNNQNLKNEISSRLNSLQMILA